ncbi:MAG: carboxylesterase/lipase family protein [Lachnospiraceae bacterium]|jgi:para-nitrobenzyl esterase|nr:carboxylesterase/lipase family protein [Lachnospiraceae bacterium]
MQLQGLTKVKQVAKALHIKVQERRDYKTKKRIRSMYGVNCPLREYSGDLGVTCHNGTFVGLKKDDVISYKGIPYAIQPVGKLRWKPSKLAPDNNGIYEAYYFGKSSIQTEVDSELASYYMQGEDCLSLNVWVNSKNTDKKKPVMVFLPGGAYGWGGTADPLYNGHNLVKKFDDIILVTVNYRTGLFGFIDFSSVEGGERFKESGNLGLLDQVTALKWVQKNIAAFGGDPDNVTVFGESAGAGSVSLLMVLPIGEGLFKRVIAESGAVALTFSREECKLLTEKLLKESGCRNMKELMALSEEKLKELNRRLNAFNNFPERDDVIIPSDIRELYYTSRGKDVDFMTGTNADESHYWVHEIGGYHLYKYSVPIMYENNMKMVTSKVDRRRIKNFMQDVEGDLTERYSEFFDETMFRMPAIEMAENHARFGGNTYMYYWTYPSALPHMGACHAVELAYVFNNLNETIYTGDNIDENLADTVQNMWVNFARCGNPSTESITWEKYDESRKTLILDSEIAIIEDPLARQRKLLKSLIVEYPFNATYMSMSFKVPTVYKYLTIAALVVGIPITASMLTFRLILNRK